MFVDLSDSAFVPADATQPSTHSPATNDGPARSTSTNANSEAAGKALTVIKKVKLSAGDAVGEDSFLEKTPFLASLRCDDSGKAVVSVEPTHHHFPCMHAICLVACSKSIAYNAVK